MRSIKHNAGGFTIVEIIVTIVVGAILVTAVSQLLISQENLSQRNKNYVIANAFAEAKVEGLRNSGYLSVADGTTDISSELPSTLPSPKSASLEANDTVAGLKEVTLIISFKDGANQRSVSYKTMIGEIGVGQN